MQGSTVLKDVKARAAVKGASRVLGKFVAKQMEGTVVFDPTNPEHMGAYLMLTNNFSRGQHPTLRFHLEYPYLNVVAMMQDKIARAYVKTQFRHDAGLMSMMGEPMVPGLEVKYIEA